MDATVVNKIDKTLSRYGDKDEIKFIVLSKKLNKYLGHPKFLSDLEVLTSDKIYNYAYYFTKEREHKVPDRAHTIEFKEVTYPGIEISRTVKPLTDEVFYNTKVAAGMTMEEVAFCMANLIKEMNEAGYAKTQDMLNNINKYLEMK